MTISKFETGYELPKDDSAAFTIIDPAAENVMKQVHDLAYELEIRLDVDMSESDDDTDFQELEKRIRSVITRGEVKHADVEQINRLMETLMSETKVNLNKIN